MLPPSYKLSILVLAQDYDTAGIINIIGQPDIVPTFTFS